MAAIFAHLQDLHRKRGQSSIIPHWAGLLRAGEASLVARLPVSLLGPVLRACGLEALAV